MCRKTYNVLNMNKLISLWCVLVCVFVGQILHAQVSNLTVENTAPANTNIASNGYEVGMLKVSMNLATKSIAKVKITFPKGVKHDGSAITVSGGTATAPVASGNDLTFDLTPNTAGGIVTFSLKKTITPEGHKEVVGGKTLQDQVSVTQGSTAQKKGDAYSNYKYPSLVITDPTPKADSQKGDNTTTFTIANGGEGKIESFYLSLKYPNGLTLKTLKVGTTNITVPTKTGDKYIIAIPAAAINSGNGLVKGGAPITITETYTQAGRCASGDIEYIANWGKSATNADWYQAMIKGKDNYKLRKVSTPSAAPDIKMNTGNNDSYFTMKNGFNVPVTPVAAATAPVANVMGTMRVSYKNNAEVGSGGAAYKVNLLIQEKWNDGANAFFRPINFRIVKSDGTTTPIPTSGVKTTTSGNITGQNKLFSVSLEGLTTDPDGADGLEDLDADGKFDDLAPGKSFAIEFDLVKNRTDVSDCLTGKGFILAYSSYVGYTTTCGTTPVPAIKNQYDLRAYILNLLTPADVSFIPPVLVKDAPALTARFAGKTSQSEIEERSKGGTNELSKYRFQYVITIPDGVEVDQSTIKWHSSANYPVTTETINLTAGHPNLDIKQNGGSTVIKVLSPEGERGFVTMDLKAKCGTNKNVQVNYELFFFDKYSRANNALKLLCVDKPVQIICDGCANNGPLIINTEGERSENSLGWKDYTMRERHTKATLKAADPLMLRRALPLDEIEIVSKGKQGAGTANNLYYSFTSNEGMTLEPKELVFKITSGANNGYIKTINTFAETSLPGEGGVSIRRIQKFVWTLLSAADGKTLQPNDAFEVKVTYKVKPTLGTDVQKREYSAQDRLIAQKVYFYMLEKDAQGKDVERYCGAPNVPEFYIADTFPHSRYNGDAPYYVLTGCTPKDLGGYTVHLARRFNTRGTAFNKEFRPDRLVKKSEFTLPNSYKVTDVKYYYVQTAGGKLMQVVIPADKIKKTSVGNSTKYTIENELTPNGFLLPPGIIQVENGYSSHIQVWTQATCASPQSTNFRIKTWFYDFYYHYARVESDPSKDGRVEAGVEYNDEDQQNGGRNITLNNMPSIRLDAGTTIETLAQKTNDLSITLRNTGANTAPYTWISVPEVTGVEVLGLYDGANAIGRVSTITGEYMYYLSSAGLAKGASKNYTLKVKLNDCKTATLTAYAGWNCTEYPTSYENSCSSNLQAGKTTYTLQAAVSEIQFTRTKSPQQGTAKQGKLEMCKDNIYEYIINASKEGDIIDPKLLIHKETGIKIAKVEVYYPSNATTPTKNYTVVPEENGAWVYKLLDDGEALKGLKSEPNDVNKRNIRVAITVVPECSVRAGAIFRTEVQGKSACDGSIQGTRDADIISDIDGITPIAYSVVPTLVHQSGSAKACGVGAIYRGTYKVTSSSPSAQTGNTDKLVIRVPKGYNLSGFTFVSKSGTFINPTDFENANPAPQGDIKEYTIAAPQGMKNGDEFTYTIKVMQVSTAAASDCEKADELQYYAIANVAAPPCPSGACANIERALATPVRVPILTNRSALSIKDLSATTQIEDATKEKRSLSFKVGTTTETFSGQIRFKVVYDTNNNGKIDATDEQIATFLKQNLSIPANGTVAIAEAINVPADKVCRLLIGIEGADNPCLCSIDAVQVPAPTQITGLVKNLTLCAGESKTFEKDKAAQPTYHTYEWKSSSTEALGYLSAANILQPTFHYTGATFTGTKTFTYTLEITREGGCKATQTVTVTVNNTPVALPATPFCVNDKKKVGEIKEALKNINAGTTVADFDVFEQGNNSPLGDQTYVDQTKVYEVQRKAKGANCASEKVVFPTKAQYITAYNGEHDQDVLCPGATIADLKTKIAANEHVSVSQVKIYNRLSNGTKGTEITNGNQPLEAVEDTTPYNYKYQFTVFDTTNTKCESEGRDIKVHIVGVTATTTKTTYCQGETVNITYKVRAVKGIGTATGLPAGLTVNYNPTAQTVQITGTATVGTYTYAIPLTSACTTAQITGTITIGSVDKPTVSVAAATCTASGTTATITNYDSTATYSITPNTGVTITGSSITGLTVGTAYTLKATKGTCDSPNSDSFTATAQLTVPAKPTVSVSAATCTASGTTATITNYDSTATYSITPNTGVTITGSSITGLTVGTAYTLKATKGTCDSPNSDSFTATAQLTVPAKPTVSVSAATCTASGTTATITNYDSGATYAITPNAGVTITGSSITGLTVGTSYTLKATKGTCDSPDSDSFTATAKLAVPAVPTLKPITDLCPTAASHQVSFGDYVNTPAVGTLYWYTTATTTVSSTTAPTIDTNVTTKTVVTHYVAVVNAQGCESTRVPITLTIDDTTNPSLSVPPALVVDCKSATRTATIDAWLAQATASDTCQGVVTPTNDYTPPADPCAAGTTTVTFTAKDKFGNTVTKTSVITNLSVIANGDTNTTTINGGTGAPNVIDVLSNDKVNGKTPTVSTVSLTVTNPATPKTPGANVPTLDKTTGKVTVPPSTPAGTYTIVYQICATLSSTTACDSAIVTITVSASQIIANPDIRNIPNGANGGTVSNVLSNDRLNGNVPSTNSVTLTWGTVPSGWTGNSDGTITVPAGTRSGTYTVTYTICDKLNTSNCSSTSVTVTVGAPPIVANPDRGNIPNGANGGTVSNVLSNDRLNGNVPSTNSVTLTWGTVPSGWTGNSDGTITVPAGTRSGTYTVTYTICDKLNTSNCSSTSVTVTVGVPPIVANPDTGNIPNGANGGTVSSVIPDDSYNGQTPPPAGTVTATFNNIPSGWTGNPDGTITVPAGTRSGTYTMTYHICDALGNCSNEATVTVTVGAPPIVATDDNRTIPDGTTGGTVTNVLTNDTLNGIPVGNTTSVTLTWTNTPAGWTGNPDGTVTVPPNTPAGVYTITYTICEKANPTNCDSAVVTVTVSVPSVALKANDDPAAGTFTNTIGGTTTSVLANDTYNGVPNPSLSSVTLTWNTATPTGFTYNNDGTITVAAGTATGTYQISYTICTKVGTVTCSTATATVRVVAATPTPTVNATDDHFTATTTGVIGNVLTNDTVDTTQSATTTNVTISVTTVAQGVGTSTTVPVLNPATGDVTVPNNTPSGTYTIVYQICTVATPTACDTATVTVVVPPATVTPTIEAVDDTATTTLNTPVNINVLSNDKDYGTTPQVSLQAPPSNGTAIVNADGNISYTPNTNYSGTDSFVYELCDGAGNCVTATVTIDVIADIIPYNAISVDGDGINDHFQIGGIEAYPDNVVRIYNRWGVKVYEQSGYDNVTKVFRGISNGRVTVEANEKLPQGTYYYVIEYTDTKGNRQNKVGWLYIKKK